MEGSVVQQAEFGKILQKNPILKIEDLSVSRSGKTIIKDIDLTIEKGEFVGIVGPNGSGKSTLLLSILGAVSYTHLTLPTIYSV